MGYTTNTTGETMSKLHLLPALAGALMLSACATIVTGNKQSIKVDSNPQGAKVFVATVHMTDGKKSYGERSEIGVTPITVTVERKDGAILLEKAGFEPAEVPLHRSLNKWVWGDVALLSLLSTSVDTSTGASNEFDPGEYLVEMKAINP
jgi:hypothetical protein